MTQHGKLQIVRFGVILLLLAGFGTTAAVPAQQATIAGLWKGAIQLPTGKLGIIVELQRDSTGAWSGDIDIPLQGARDLPLTAIQIEDHRVRFAIENVPGNPTFDGTFEPDSGRIAGKFTQSGQTFSFELRRQGKAPRAKVSLSEKLQQIRAFIDSTRKSWKVPGVAVAIVKNDRVILAQGFGLRDVKSQQPVTENTLFAIGSCTKAFTTLALGMLADDGVLNWDKPVREYLPDFELKDPFASEHMTPRDLVTHRSGLPRHDMLWYGANFSREELFHRLKYLEPSKEFRTAFQYQNLMFMTAGLLVGRLAGSTWEAFVKSRIFQPLGMLNSNFSVAVMQRQKDFALPYRKEKNEVKRIPFRNIDVMGPAGSINSSVKEMANWMLLHLNGGRFHGNRLISESQLKQMHTPQMVIGRPNEYPEALYTAYGLGWFVQSYRGHERVFHGGNIDGFSALVSLLPRDRLGVVVLCNLDATPYPSLVAYYVSDLLLGLEPVDWNTRLKMKVAQAEQIEKNKAKEELIRKKDTRPSHPLREYTGEYEHPAYGVITVSLKDGHLQAIFHSFTAELQHWHFDVFRFMNDELQNPKIQFLSNELGDIDRLSVQLEPTVAPAVFKRRPEAKWSRIDYLQQFVGEYSLQGVTVKVQLKGKTLTINIAGQQEYKLEPTRRLQFNLKGLEGYRVQFEQDEKQNIRAAIFIQPNGIFRAERKK